MIDSGWSLVAAGFAGSVHCAGMCGGLAILLGPSPAGRAATLARHLLYASGRLTTYAFLGALAGAAGSALTAPLGIALGQRVLAAGAGFVMIAMGLKFLGFLGGTRPAGAGLGGEAIVRALRAIRGAAGPAAPLAYGVFHGFLPCPLVAAFLAQAASMGGAPAGAGVMAAFGAGTVPSLLLAAGLRPFVGARASGRWVSLAGGLVIALGAVTASRGLLFGGPPA